MPKVIDITPAALAAAIAKYKTNRAVAAHFDCSEGTIVLRRKAFNINPPTRIIRTKDSETITCKCCKQEKHVVNDFYYNKQGIRKYAVCKACVITDTMRRAASKPATQTDKDRKKEAAKSYRRREEFAAQVGLSIADHPDLFALWCEVKEHQQDYHTNKHSITCPDTKKAAKEWNDKAFNFFKSIREKQG